MERISAVFFLNNKRLPPKKKINYYWRIYSYVFMDSKRCARGVGGEIELYISFFFSFSGTIFPFIWKKKKGGLVLLSIIGDSDISDIIYDEFRTWIALHGPELVSVPMHEGEGGGGMVLGFYFFLGLLNVWTRRIRRRRKKKGTHRRIFSKVSRCFLSHGRES